MLAVSKISNRKLKIITPADLQGQDHGNWPHAIYHTVITLAVMAGIVYVTIWSWSRNPGMQGMDTPGEAKHWTVFVWTFGIMVVVLAAWLIW